MGTALEAVTGPLTVEVGRGDTVHGIARRYGSSAREIIALNDLSAPYRLRVGQQIRLPHGRFYTVQKGETLYGIAQRSGVDLGVLVRENKIAPPYRVAAGIRLKLPVTQAVETADTEWAKPVVEARLEPMANDSFVVPRRRPHTTDEAIPLSGDKFLWPIEGPLISKFGPKPDGKHNDGINIAVPVGSEVRASQNGVVAYAGNELRGYGNLILIRHSDGWMTAYAHNDTLLVEKGEAVRRGQVISWSGKSGRVSRPQAHFEIRRNGKPQDPLLLLSRR
jgi:murein DD-endopeptidase MepM/ murein hydrolase activator NlpD